MSVSRTNAREGRDYSADHVQQKIDEAVKGKDLSGLKIEEKTPAEGGEEPAGQPAGQRQAVAKKPAEEATPVIASTATQTEERKEERPEDMVRPRAAEEPVTSERAEAAPIVSTPQDLVNPASGYVQEEDQEVSPYDDNRLLDDSFAPADLFVDTSTEQEEAVVEEEEEEEPQEYVPSAVDESAEEHVPTTREKLAELTATVKRAVPAFPAVRPIAKAMATRRAARKGIVSKGNDINTKLVQVPGIEVGMREVSLGTDIALESIRQGSDLLFRVNDRAAKYNEGVEGANLRADFNIDEFLDESTQEASMEELMDVVNQIGLYVVLSKAPISEPTSTQKRVLKMHKGAGIALNPLSAKGFTADFDGDGGTLHLRAEKLKQALDAMECLFSIDDNSPMLDLDFFPLPLNTRKCRNAVIESLNLSKALYAVPKDKRWNLRQEIADAVMGAAEAKDLRKFCEAIRKIDGVGTNTTKDGVMRARARALDAIYESLRAQMYLRIDEMVEDAYYRPSEGALPSYTYSDAELLGIIENAKLPPNYQDFVRALHRFSGDVAGKNPHFRVGADIGKLTKFNQNIFVRGHAYINNTYPAKNADGEVMKDENGNVCYEVRAEGDVIVRQNPDGSFEFFGQQGMRMLYECSLKAMEAKIMSASAYAGETTLNRNRWLRNRVVSSVGTPANYMAAHPAVDDNGQYSETLTFKRWYEEFRGAYNEGVAQIQAATNKMDSEGQEIKDENSSVPAELPAWNAAHFQDIVNAVLKIYGDMRMGAFFRGPMSITFGPISEKMAAYTGSRDCWRDIEGRVYLASKYKLMTLKEFSRNNHARRLLDTMPDEKTGQVKERFVASARPLNEPLRGTHFLEYFLNAVADKRTSAASKYHQQLTRNNLEAMEALKNIHFIDGPQDEGFDSDRRRHKARTRWIETLFASDPNLFLFHGIDSLDSWNDSVWGMYTHRHVRNFDEFGGMRYSMIMEKELAPIADIIVDGRGYNWDQINRSTARELENLASRSDFWEATVKELKMEYGTDLGGSAFQILCEGGMDEWNKTMMSRCSSSSFKSRITISELIAKLEAKTWSSFVEFMADVKVPQSWKDQVAADITRFHVQYKEILDYEVAYMMTVPVPDSHKSSNTFGYRERSEDLLQKSTDSFKKIKKPRSKVLPKNWKQISSEKIEEHVKTMAKPWNSIQFKRSYFLGAVFAPMNKVYADTEKAKQHPAVKLFYEMLSFQRSGGLFSGVCRGDNMALDMLAADQISAADFARALTDPDYSITCYDLNGNTFELNQETLAKSIDGDSSDPDFIKEFFEKYPSLWDHMNECWMVSDGTDTAKRVSVRGNEFVSFKEDPKNHIRYVVYDDPSFGAMVAALTPVEGKRESDAKKAALAIEEELIDRIASCARTGREVKPEHVKLPEGVEAKVAEDLRNDFADAFNKLARDVAAECSKEELKDFKNRKVNFDVADGSSINLFFDARQVLNGAKTATSTPIEGMESALIGLAYPYFTAQENKYAQVGENVVPIDEAIEQPRGIFGFNSIQKLLGNRRSKDSEEYNLKAKKMGLDDFRSITKFSRYAVGQDGIIDKMRNLENPTKDQLVRMLGHHLRNVDVTQKLGYADIMSEADWCNVADVMVRFNEETGEFKIVSLEQIGAAVRTSLGGRLNTLDFDGVTYEQLVSETDKIINGIHWLGPEATVQALYEMSAPGSADTVVNPVSGRYSSIERNFEAILGLTAVSTAEGVKNFKLLTNKQIKEQQEVLERFGDFQMQFSTMFKSRHNPKLLGYVGENDSDYVLSPGPRNFIMVDSNIPEEQMEQLISDCMKTGTNMAVSFPEVPSEQEQAFEKFNKKFGGLFIEEHGQYYLPSFDYKLNGGYTTAKSGRWVQNPDSWVVYLEDSLNEYGLGDAVAFAHESFSKRVEISHTGEWTDSPQEMFAHTLDTIDDSMNFKVRIATVDEIEDNIINWNSVGNARYARSVTDTAPEIDMRIADSNPGWDRIVDNMQRRLDEYRKNWNHTDRVMTKSKPDRIIGWAAMDIYEPGGTTPVRTVFAPIMPFTRYAGNMKTAPQKYEVTSSVRFDQDTGNLTFTWKNTTGIKGQFAKIFEGGAAGNKMITMLDGIKDRLLLNGLPIDITFASASTASRRLGWNRRLQTLYSMFAMARRPEHGYNIAEDARAFNSFPDVKDALLTGEPIGRDRWLEVIASEDPVYEDRPNRKPLNGFLVKTITDCLELGIRPEDFLASYKYVGDTRMATNICFDYEMILDESREFQEGLMVFLNRMMPDFCSEGLVAVESGTKWPYLFRQRTDVPMSDFDYGCMQMQVPRVGWEKGGYTWENVFMSLGFFSEDYSGMHSPGLDGSQDMMQETTVGVQTGLINDKTKKQLASYAELMSMSAGRMPRKPALAFMNSNVRIAKGHLSDTKITSFRGEHIFLSNMQQGLKIVEKESGVVFTNVEAAYQSFKLANPADRKRMRNMSGLEAKEFIKTTTLPKKSAEEFRKYNHNCMKYLLWQKFSQNESMKERLLATGDAELIEGNTWGDGYWGYDLKRNAGKNYLGTYLMQIRDELRKREKE